MNSEFTYELADGESVTHGVIEAIERVSGSTTVPGSGNGAESRETQEPLYTAVDPEALETLFAAGKPQPDGEVQFRYHGYRIVVRGDGRISVAEA